MLSEMPRICLNANRGFMRFYFGALVLTAIVFAPFSPISLSPTKHFYCLQPNGEKNA